MMTKVRKWNEEVIRDVRTGDGNARADGFTQDGIYMPHFNSMIIGVDSIRKYMLKTYNPAAKVYVQHTYHAIYDLKEFVLVNGHFKGGWGDKDNGGTFEGNMSNLRKKGKDGKFLMHRQLANNDRGTVVF